MKVLLMLVLLVFGNAVKAESENHNELFSPQENSRVFKAIDFICGDIWCEGYYDYKFQSFSCDKDSNHCDLSFQFIESVDDRVKIYSPIKVCRIDGIHSIDQIMKNDEFLKFEFIDKLSDCFEDQAQAYSAQ